jgi:hypothetical protein
MKATQNIQSTSREPRWVQLSNVPYARTPMLQNADRKCVFRRCHTTHGTPRTRPPSRGMLDHTIPKCFFRPFTDQRHPWKNSKIKMVLEQIRPHQHLRLPTDWGWRDDGIIMGTDGFKRQQERNALQNEKSRHRQGRFQRHTRRLLEFEREGKVPLYPEIIFCSCCQFTKLRPYATFFGIWQILNDGLPNH